MGFDAASRMLLSGETLSAGTIEWDQRPASPPPIALTDRDKRLMALLHGANFLSASQLVVLGWRSSRAAQMRLKRLHDAAYVDRFRPAYARGRAEWHYRLTSQGFSALTRLGVIAEEHSYTPVALTSLSYAEHDLQLAALVLHIAQRAIGEHDGALLERMPFEWKGPRNGRIDVQWGGGAKPSEALKPRPGTSFHHEGSRRGYLEPDATLIAGSGDERWAVLIEYDRTERPHKQLDRLRRYDGFLLDGFRCTGFAAHVRAPTVIYLTARERPLRRLVKEADKIFSAWRGHEHAGMREGTHPAREQVLFTSRERILAGDWTMLQTPGIPPRLRNNPLACRPHEVEYDLPSLLADAGCVAAPNHDSRDGAGEVIQAFGERLTWAE
jgi:hypothetical protein